jgi:hypothetical protein
MPIHAKRRCQTDVERRNNTHHKKGAKHRQ